MVVNTEFTVSTVNIRIKSRVEESFVPRKVSKLQCTSHHRKFGVPHGFCLYVMACVNLVDKEGCYS